MMNILDINQIVTEAQHWGKIEETPVKNVQCNWDFPPLIRDNKIKCKTELGQHQNNLFSKKVPASTQPATNGPPVSLPLALSVASKLMPATHLGPRPHSKANQKPSLIATN
ncbi:hypothetical protein DSO57_1011331 [Entomophthora muscae]|uniref:Uncharacterized protein n=1 Tax=Entomophthora muscae TaxID=34485 RepID=A0ACC2T7A1_9FUNG|nr:hypothetical protein DSO57_1011331 [Entomophthora muscae]